jgi:hypothetical protein
MEVRAQIHALAALPPETYNPVTTEQVALCAAQQHLETSLLTLQEIEPQYLGHLDRSLIAIPSELTRLTIFL